MTLLETPDARILNRVTDENNLIVFNDFAKQIDDLVNLGSHILMKDWLNKKNSHIDLPAQGLFRHCLDIGDAISALIKIGSGETIKILLRNLFETNLYLEFLFEKDTEKRSLCYMTFSKISEYEMINKYNPETPEGRAVIERNKDKHPDLEQNLIIDSSLKILANIFSQEPYNKIFEDYKEKKSKNSHKHIQWYSLYDEPQSIFQLAKYLKYELDYDTIYNQWSKSVHSSATIVNNMVIDEAGMVNIHGLRNPNYIQEGYHFAKGILQRIITLYIKSRKIAVSNINLPQ